MACDTAYTHSSGMQFKGGPKMLVLEKEVAKALFDEKKAIIGGCGNAEALGAAWAWLGTLEGKPPKTKEAEYVALVGSKRIYTSSNLINWIWVDKPYYAIGSGMHFALGAMAGGKSAVQAVKVAIEFDPSSNYDVIEYKV
jgi:hypothetical protein